MADVEPHGETELFPLVPRELYAQVLAERDSLRGQLDAARAEARQLRERTLAQVLEEDIAATVLAAVEGLAVPAHSHTITIYDAETDENT